MSAVITVTVLPKADRPEPPLGATSLSSAYEITIVVKAMDLGQLQQPIVLGSFRRPGELEDTRLEQTHAVVFHERLQAWLALPTEIDPGSGRVLVPRGASAS